MTEKCRLIRATRILDEDIDSLLSTWEENGQFAFFFVFAWWIVKSAYGFFLQPISSGLFGENKFAGNANRRILCIHLALDVYTNFTIRYKTRSLNNFMNFVFRTGLTLVTFEYYVYTLKKKKHNSCLQNYSANGRGIKYYSL